MMMMMIMTVMEKAWKKGTTPFTKTESLQVIGLFGIMKTCIHFDIVVAGGVVVVGFFYCTCTHLESVQ